MTRSTSSSNSSTHRSSIVTQQPWDAIKWFWRFSRFYGNYIPNGTAQAHRLTKLA